MICASAAHQPTAALLAVARAPVRHDVIFGTIGTNLSGTVTAVSLPPVSRGVQIPAEGHVTVDVEVTARTQLAGAVQTATAGSPVPEALATLIAADGQVVGSVITDASGGFVFDNVATGTYNLITVGYPPVTTEVTLGGEAPTAMVITLEPPIVGPASLESPLVAMNGNGAVGDSGREERSAFIEQTSVTQ